MRYENLISQGLMSPSVADLLFDPRKRSMPFRSNSYPAIAFNIGLFYTALTQAYVLAYSIKNNKLLSECNLPEFLSQNVKDTWDINTKRPDAFRTGKPWVFSFLNQCAKSKHDDIFGEGALKAIEKAKYALIESNKNARHFDELLREEDLIGFIKSLPLLHTTEIDFDTGRFIFTDDAGEAFSIDFQPFLCFWNTQNNTQSQSKSDTCYIITSAKKGKQQGEVCVNMLPLNSKDSNIKPKQIYWQISQNEAVRMIFKSLEIQNDLTSIKEYWCDLEFMQRLATVAETVLPIFWQIKKSDIKKDLRPYFVNLFNDQSIIATLNHKRYANSKILLSNIGNTLFGLFINHGIFRTMRDLFECPAEADNDNLEGLFLLFLKQFVKNKYIDENAMEVYQVECNKQIDMHLATLKTKVPYENSPQFLQRSREIRAEWRAFTILKAAGIKADNLFVDKEAIYSIDDYFNMIQNPRTALEDDLKQVLSLLVTVYGALIDNSRSVPGNSGNTRLNEDKYYADMQKIRKELENSSLEELFERFEAIVRASENNKLIYGLLGRERICDPNLISVFKADIFDALDKNASMTSSLPVSKDEKSDERYLFISYCRKDEKKVLEFVDHCHKQNINVYLDQERFKEGTTWLTKACSAIKSKNCAAVIVFMSENAAISDPMRSEIYAAEEELSTRDMSQDKEEHPFIITINLDEKRMPSDYFLSIKTSTTYSNQEKDVATFMHKKILDIDIFAKFSQLMTDKHDSFLKSLISYVPKRRSEMRDINYTELENQIVKFYILLKYGDLADWNSENPKEYFKGNDPQSPSLSQCIYPIVAYMKETRIHRDNITMVGYEMFNSEHRDSTNYILTSKLITDPDDYYCIPHLERVGADCSWMLEPLLISYKRMLGK